MSPAPPKTDIDMDKLAPATTALVAIDLQRGVAGMETAPHAPKDVIARSATIARTLRAAGGPIVWVRVSFAADFSDALRQPVDAPMPRGAARPPNWDELLPELGMAPGDLVVTKRQWGAFYGTDLDMQLRRRGVRTIILTGIATNFGVESTARDAWERNYALVFAEDATSARSAADHRFAIETIFPRLGLVRPTAEVVAAIAAP
jgi:nicotinamidase-related amidase